VANFATVDFVFLEITLEKTISNLGSK